MALFGTLYKALLFDDKGEHLDIVGFKRKSDIIAYAHGTNARKFNYIPDNCSYWEKRGIFFNKRYYFYNVNNPNPYIFKKTAEPVINSKIYRVMLDTKVAQDLNKLASGGLAQYLTPKNIIIGLIILGVIIYFASGGTISNIGNVATQPAG